MASKKTIRRKQKRVEKIIASFQKYVATYSDQLFYQDYSDNTIVHDMLYGIGIAFDNEKFKMAGGYDAWKKILQQFMKDPKTPMNIAALEKCKSCPHYKG